MIRTITNTFRSLLLAGALAFGASVTGISNPLAPVIAHADVTPNDFGTLPMVRDAAISPDGKRIALYGSVEGKHALRILTVDGTSSAASGIVLPKGIKPGWVRWANNDRVLISAWRTEDYEGFAYNMRQLFSYDVNTGKGDWLIKPKRFARSGSRIGAKDPFYELDYADVVDWLPNDDAHILMSFSDETGGVRPVHRVNVATGNFTTVERATRAISGFATDLTGTVRVARGLKRGATDLSDYNLRILDTDGQWKTNEHWRGLDEDTRIFGFMKNPAEMVIGSRNGRDTYGLYVYDLGTRAITRKIFHDDTYDVDGPVRDKVTREVIGARFTGDTGEVKLLPGHNDVQHQVSSEYSDFLVSYVDSSDGGDTLLFKISQPYDPGMLLLKKKGTPPVKIADYRPQLPADEMGLVVPVKYAARDGQKIPAYVTLPPMVNDASGIKKLPFIIYPHGGPYARDAQRFDYMAQFFASRGYGVLQMNFRGSTGYGEHFALAGRNDWGVMRTDALDGAKWLVDKGYADPDRMCMAGWSFGGYSALMNGVEHPELFQCVISIAALSDLEAELADMQNYRNRKIVERIITDGFADKDAMRAGSPVRVAERMTLPTFIAHGMLDVNVDYGQHKTLHRALKNSPAKVTELTFKDDDHYMSVQANRQKMLRELDKFLVRVNGPSEFMKK